MTKKQKYWQTYRARAAATVDSVKAVLRYLSYEILRSDYEDLWTIVQRLFDSEKAYDTAKGNLLKGDPI